MLDLSHLVLKMFARSPMEHLSGHMSKSYTCVSLLPDFFHHVFDKDWSQALLVKQNINDLESQADALKKQVYVQLHSDLLLPVSRQDILALVKSQDRIANDAQDIAGLVYGRRIAVPKDMQEPLDAFVCSSVMACQQAANVVDDLGVALKNSFSKESRHLVQKKIDQLDAYEHDNDMKQIALRDMLWREEKKLSPVDVVFLYDVLHRIGGLADNANHVGSKLLLMMAGR